MTTTRRRTAKKTKKHTPLSDTLVQNLCDEYEALKADAAIATAEAKKIQEKLIAELDHRKTDQIEWTGGRLKKTQATTVTISVDKLSEMVDTDTLQDVTTLVVDKTLLSAAVQNGKISAKVVADASEVTKKAPYITVSHGTGD